MQTMYETRISNARWMAYDLPGNVGWIMYLVCLGMELHERVTVLSALSVVPAIFMLVGVVELISERIAKLDRVLSKARLYRGFGALTLGGVLGIVLSAVQYAMGMSRDLSLRMLLGSSLCAVFAGLIFAGYQKQQSDGE